MVTVALFDIDGTLIPSSGVMSETVRSAVLGLKDFGVRVGLATGRPMFSCKEIAEELQINALSTFFAGSVIADPRTWRVEKKWTLNGESLFNLYLAAKNAKIYMELYDVDGYISEEWNEITEMHMHYVKKPPVLGSLEERIHCNEQFVKALFCVERTREGELRRLIGDFPQFQYGFATGASHPEWIFCNVTSLSAKREVVFQELVNRLGVSASEVVSFGDGEQDIPFIVSAGIGVAMSNAPQSVKDAADIVAPSVEDDGVAKVLDKLVFHRLTR